MNVAARILGAVRATPVHGFKRRRVAFAGDGFRVAMQEAIDFHRQKVRLPTKGWRDLDGRAHDRAFVIAGATKDAFLSDMHKVVGDVLQDGITPAEFREKFEDAVARHGWTGWRGEGTEAGRAWRANVIYGTNLRTAHAAGRWAQMTSPKMLKLRPYWQYRHGETRRPASPRAQHVAWDGKIYLATDPWWQIHYPPNDWLCSCGVRALSVRDLARMGREVPDTPPPETFRRVKDPATGDIVQVPEGIGFGWDHAPGRDWAEGLVPRELQAPLDVLPDDLDKSPMPEMALPPVPRRPLKSPLLPADLPAEDYARAFLGEFGAHLGKTVLWRDPAGLVTPISDQMFRDGAGKWKADKHGRGDKMLQLAEALKDPDEIWLSWERMRDDGSVSLVRTYLRHGDTTRSMASFRWWVNGWTGATTFNPGSESYFRKLRRGVLFWRRPE